MKILYFAWIRSKIGIAEEVVSLPANITNVGDLLNWLTMRGPQYAAALKERGVIKAAVNQEYVSLDHPIKSEDEVAFFPPVTGG